MENFDKLSDVERESIRKAFEAAMPRLELPYSGIPIIYGTAGELTTDNKELLKLFNNGEAL